MLYCLGQVASMCGTWAQIVAIATTGLSALAREAEGTHADAVKRLREHADRLHTLVTNW